MKDQKKLPKIGQLDFDEMLSSSLKSLPKDQKKPATNSINDLPRNMYDATQDPFSTVR